VKPYRPEPAELDPYTPSRTRMGELVAHLATGQMSSCTQEELELYVTSAGRELQRQLLQDNLDQRARTEQRLDRVVGGDGVARTRAERGHRRLLSTTVGRVDVERIAYRAPGVSNLYPADAVLDLPGHLYSRPLQAAIVTEAACGSLRSAASTIEHFTGQRIGTRQIMEVCGRAAVDVTGFYRLPGAGPGPGQDLLVLSCDATGVNMIPSGLRPAVVAQAQAKAAAEPGPRPPSAQLADRERTGKRRMATVTALYDATATPRNGADVLPRTAAERTARSRQAPKATRREVHASVRATTAEMITVMFDHAQERDPGHHRRWIVLVDGNNHQIERIEHEAAERGVHIDIIIDFVHVLEYLWRAAEDLHPTMPARQGFVAHAARDVLDGHAGRVVADLRSHARTRSGEKDPGAVKANGIERTAAYLDAKKHYLGYDLALTLGWPIATGVIEGCCRSRPGS
jgi:hypothetical protein